MTKTKDEKFILCLYENTLRDGDSEKRYNRYEVGNQIGLQFRGVDTICKLLVQANFIKKDGEDEIYLTPHGAKLGKLLYEEK
jgi:hypothetical protein